MARKPKKKEINNLGHNHEFTTEIKLHWLRLLRSENIGPISFYHLLKRYGNAEEAVKRLPELAHRAGRQAPLMIPSMQDIMKEYTTYEKLGASLIAQPEFNYPAALREITDAPPLLSALGRIELLARTSFSIVGARNASAAGQQLSEKFALELGQKGQIISSGMARGIDTFAHKGALNTGTIAVLAGGIDFIYPPENKALYKKIISEGLVISEAPLGKVPQASFFPRRNRIISGLSWGTLIIEAASKSGSLITARYALEQNREVFAVPGSPLDPRSYGANQLIQQGATLVQNIEDILEHYQTQGVEIDLKEDEEEFSYEAPVLEEDIERALKRLLTLLSPTPTPVNNLVSLCEASVATVRSALVEIEIAGYLERHPGDTVSLLEGGYSLQKIA